MLIRDEGNIKALNNFAHATEQGADAKLLDLSQRGGVTLRDLFNLEDLSADAKGELLSTKRDPR